MTQYPIHRSSLIDLGLISQAAKRKSGIEVYTDDPEEEAKFVFVGDIKKASYVFSPSFL
jgi:hypothetical protein